MDQKNWLILLAIVGAIVLVVLLLMYFLGDSGEKFEMPVREKMSVAPNYDMGDVSSRLYMNEGVFVNYDEDGLNDLATNYLVDRPHRIISDKKYYKVLPIISQTSLPGTKTEFSHDNYEADREVKYSNGTFNDKMERNFGNLNMLNANQML